MSDSPLFSPFQLGPIQLKNRIALAPMTRARAGKDRLANALMAEYYVQRSGAGLIIAEATTISEQANGWNDTPGIYTDAMTEAWKPVVKAVQNAGSRFFLQLWHMGRASHTEFHPGRLPVAASANKLSGHIYAPSGKLDYETPRALETAEIPGIVEEYRLAARRAKEAGFDGVEIHAANGYLIDNFLQSKTNQRTDKYGGSVENRTQFLLEVTEAVTSVWGADRVGVRLSPNGMFNEMGSPDFREQFSYAAKQLDRFGLAYLHVMDGLAFGFHELGEAMTLKEFRPLFRGTLMGNCGYTKEAAEAAIASGDADLIAFGRPFISNPDLVERLRNNWPLAETGPMETWWVNLGAKGLTDYPTYSPESA